MMRRLAIFAHFDRDNVIDDYVLHYLMGLQAVASRILFVSDCPLPRAEIAKLDGLAEFVSGKRHGEYDFGSWKRGFAHIGDTVSEWDEVIIANDSCYAPIYPFESIFDRAGPVACDWWGPTATITEQGDLCHMNSYFLVFRPPVLANPAFRRFWQDVTAQPSPREVIRVYEKGLTKLLLAQGFRWHAVVPPVPTPGRTASVVFTEWVHDTLHRHRASWIKVRMLRSNDYRAERLAEALQRIEPLYPRRLIDAHLGRLIGTADPPHFYLPDVPFFVMKRFNAIPGLDLSLKSKLGKS